MAKNSGGTRTVTASSKTTGKGATNSFFTKSNISSIANKKGEYNIGNGYSVKMSPSYSLDRNAGVGLNINKEYYAEMHKDGKRVAWVSAQGDALSEFTRDILNWKKKIKN